MLKRIKLINFKCYKESTLNFKDITVVVGNNNAGKSTLIEALRLVSYVVKKYKNINYSEMPKEFNLPKSQKGFKISIASEIVDLRSVVHDYGEDYAIIEVDFDSKEKVKIYINYTYAYASVFDNKGNAVSNKSSARKLLITPIRIMPQIGLIKDEEKRITDGTIERSLDTRLSSRHFRNELLYYKKEYYNDFVELAQKTWEGLRIQSLEAGYGDDPISLIVYDGSFSAEIGNMGSGLQMWLQIIWFLSRCGENDTIILDEPDVYMHPDMQKRIFNIVKDRFKQFIVATHSVEILSLVEPGNIAKLDSKTREFTYANNI